MGLASPEEFEELIRQKLPSLLRQRSDFRYEILGIMADVFASKDDFKLVLEELKKLREESDRRFQAGEHRFQAMLAEFREFREDTNRRFEATLAEIRELREDTNRRFEATQAEIRELREDTNRRFEATLVQIREVREATKAEIRELREDTNRRFEAADRRFEEITTSLKDLRLEVSALSGRLGHGLEEIVRQTVERFSGHTFAEVKRLVIKDKEGELYGVPSEVEYDLYLGNDVSYLVEVKSHAKSGDVLNFYRKKIFAEKKLEKPLKGLLIAASADKPARKKCQELGIDLMARSIF